MTFYKSVRPDGTDHQTGTVAWAASSAPVRRPRTVTHPTSREAVRGDHGTSLAASTTPWDLPGAPSDHRQMRLLTVEPADAPIIEADRTKRQSVQWRVTGEIPSWHRYGPMGEHVAALIEQVAALTPQETRNIHAAWYAAGDAARDATWYAAGDAARDATWYAAGDAARDAAWDAAWGAARYAAWYAAAVAAVAAVADVAARALVSRDLIGQYGFTQEHYDALTRPLRLAGVTVHPDDGPLP